jgi:hypothetical protein
MCDMSLDRRRINPRTAFVSRHLSRRRGIATFTRDLAGAAPAAATGPAGALRG